MSRHGASWIYHHAKTKANINKAGGIIGIVLEPIYSKRVRRWWSSSA